MAKHQIPGDPMELLSMDDAQALSYLLQLGGAGQLTSYETAHALLQGCSGLSQALRLPLDVLLAQPNLTQDTAVFLPLLADLVDRYRTSTPQFSIPVHTYDQLSKLILPRFHDQTQEQIYIFCLDRDWNCISGDLVAQGSFHTVSLSIRRAIELAVHNQVTSVFLTHNHPDGSPLFSQADIHSTAVLAQQFRLVEVALLDHFLVADGRITSLWGQLALRPSRRLPFSIPS